MHWQIGSVRITKIVEIEIPTSVRWLVPQATRESLLALPWLQPHFCTEEGRGILSVHMFVIEADGMRIAVDTCIGNDKRLPIEAWNERKGPFLSDLTEAGFAPESIDRVLCTHLHIDHVGWNTRRVGSAWVPTFPNARYLFGKRELEHALRPAEPASVTVVEESITPVLEAGLADEVDVQHRVSESVSLEPTPGHTPGHVSVYVRSQGLEAVITGDLMHHPVQCAHPEWPAAVDDNPELARETRRAFLERHAGTPTLVLGTHFAGATAGRIVRDGAAFRLEV